MDKLERFGYVALGSVAILYVFAMVIGMLSAMPYGLIGIVLLLGVGSLVIKVSKERLENKEDDYYSDKVER